MATDPFQKYGTQGLYREMSKLLLLSAMRRLSMPRDEISSRSIMLTIFGRPRDQRGGTSACLLTPMISRR